MQDDGSRSPIKRAKGRSPDIERTLAVWAKNQVSFIANNERQTMLTARRRRREAYL